MRVLHVLASSKFSGAENVVCQIINMFVGDIDMAYCSPDGQISEELKKQHIKYISLQKFNSRSIRNVVKKYKPDIIHAHDVKAIIFSALAVRSSIPLIGHIHGNEPRMRRFSLKSFLFFVFAKYCRHIFWVSKSSLEQYIFRKRANSKSSVLQNIINIKKIVEGINKQEKIYDIVYLGRLTEAKNPLRLIEIIRSYVVYHKTAKVVIVGDGEMMEQVRNFINKSKLETNIELKGYINNPYQIVSQSKAMLMSSIFEGTPMCALESMALGVPVVTTKTDGMKDIIKNGYNGFLYDTNEEAVKYLENIIKTDGNKFEINCKAFSKSYNDVEKYKKELGEIYKFGRKHGRN